MKNIVRSIIICFVFIVTGYAQTTSFDPIAQFKFDGNLSSVDGDSIEGDTKEKVSFVDGIDEQALSLQSNELGGLVTIAKKNLTFDKSSNFSIQFWIKTSMNSQKPFVILSQKEFSDKSLASQKKSGWVIYSSGGTWAWNMGTGKRRITYERDNGKHMQINNGKWHQLTMTYNVSRDEIRLFYDGSNKVVYKVNDSDEFDFTSSSPLIIGGKKNSLDLQNNILLQIYSGAQKLQELVDTFNNYGLSPVEPEQFESLIVDPQKLFEQKLKEMKSSQTAESSSHIQSTEPIDFSLVRKIRAELHKNPYTVHQVRDFNKVSALLKIYSLAEGKVHIEGKAAHEYTEAVKLYNSDFAMDNLTIWNRTLSCKEVLDSYSKHYDPDIITLDENITTLIAADWNIHHGGIHNTIEKDGWDSRLRIAEMLKEKNADVIMMQESYSNGDFIAAELGYYYATTVDWDYLNQGANISVLSRYPIKELYMPEDAPFNNVAVKVSISQTQDMFVMSNWYGMNNFPIVYDYHKERFDLSDQVPTLFAGDFNAVPHTDGGNSPASLKMLESGFTDAFRSIYPDCDKSPGYSHEEGVRIDQLYYKGKGLNNILTETISTWPGGFPSDHYLIISEFELDYSSVEEK